MKPSEKLEYEIEAVANFAYNSLEWIWQHENQSYREGTFESVCYALSNYIDSINTGHENQLFTGEDIANELQLETSKHCPNVNKIKKLIKVKLGIFVA